MKIHALVDPPDEKLVEELQSFESQFEYPLGANQNFRISHGPDYRRFSRSIGKSVCFIAEKNDQVVGVLNTVVRPIIFPDTNERSVVYICDLKIAPVARCGFTLLNLASAAREWHRETTHAFGVVMDGTRALPSRYTGRVGIPVFHKLGEIVILKIPTLSHLNKACDCLEVTASEAYRSFQRLTQGRYAAFCGNSAMRSQHPPHYMLLSDGSACALLEDTMKAKQLIQSDGLQMISAHLSCFAFQDAKAAIRLIRSALILCTDRGLPAMFVALTPNDSKAVLSESDLGQVTVAPATTYGTGFELNKEWNINTSEI